MIIKAIATAAAVLTLGLSAVAPAQAYTLHTWSDGTISWMCNDGITVGVMEDGSVPPESVIIAACAGHGGMVTSPFTGKTSKMSKAKR
jgi:hypothetical protein